MANRKEKQIPYIIAAPAEPIKVTLAPHDPTSRYKTKQIVVQSFGNRTVFQNLEKTAKKYMLIPASYLIIYFGYQLGVPTKHESTASKQLSISGLHDPKKLSKICQDFVKEVLLCPDCKLPEISHSVISDGKSKKAKGECRSCGWNGWMFSNNPKFANFVVKNPPEPISSFGSRMENDFLSKFGNMNIADGSFFSSSFASEEEQVSFEEDIKNALQETQPASKLIQVEDAIKDHRKSHAEASKVIFESIFGEETNEPEFLSKLKAQQKFLQLFLHSDPQFQNAFMESLMQHLGRIPQTQRQKIILKMFYDEEILEEDEFIHWFEIFEKKLEKNFPAVVESVKTFIDWLKQPSDDSNEE